MSHELEIQEYQNLPNSHLYQPQSITYLQKI